MEIGVIIENIRQCGGTQLPIEARVAMMWVGVDGKSERAAGQALGMEGVLSIRLPIKKPGVVIS
jgi:hypothetical protein